MRRVVITGLGTLNAIGNDVQTTWENLIAGKNGIERISVFDVTYEYASQIAAEVKNYDPKKYFERKEIKKKDKYTQFALIAAEQAMKNSGLLDHPFDHDLAGVLIASGIGGMETFENEASKFVRKGPKRISPFFIPKMISNIAAAEVAIKFDLRGINFNITSACASSMHSIGTAFRSIQYGDADLILAGGTEASITPLSVAGFSSMKALSTRNDEPHKACRPFDKERDGFIIGEGAGVVVLEEREHAIKRGAHIFAEIVGYGASCDAYHITAPAENGEGSARAMKMALHDAKVEPKEIMYINAHGTSTPLNDKNETTSIKTIFGEHAKEIKINSTKSMVGHTLGAAAAIETIACCKTLETGILHPTINYEVPDPDCDLDYIPNQAIELDVEYVLSNSLGFGGHNGAILLKKHK